MRQANQNHVCSMFNGFYVYYLFPELRIHTIYPSAFYFAFRIVGQPKYIAKKATFSKRVYDALMAYAVLAYLAELEKPYRGCHGLHTICKDFKFEQLYYEEKGVHIPLSFATLGQLADGGCNWEEAVRAETPVVSELGGATQQPWGRSLECIGNNGEAIYDTPWGRSLEKQLRISTMGVTLHIN